MAEMVWCNSCKTVVWAYDQMPKVGPQGLGGICNTFKLPCPKCGVVGNFDGWGSDSLLQVKGWSRGEIYDWWSALKYIASRYEVRWKPSPDNHWGYKGQSLIFVLKDEE